MNSNTFKKIITTTILAGLIVFTFTGCSSSGSPNENDSQAETRIVTDAKGEVEIPANPQRIVDISGNSDIFHILGYEVIGTANSDAYDYTKYPSYLEDILKDAAILGFSMQDTMDIEGILALDPDLIIISNVQEKMYQQLSDVAPTVMIEMAQIDWIEDFKKVASVMENEDAAEAWLVDYRQKATEAGESIKSNHGEDSTYLSFLASGGQIYIFDGAGLGSILYDDMGLSKPAGMPEQTNISLPVVTYEGLASIDADFIFAVGTPDDLAALTENPVWNSLEAVKNNNVVELPASPYFIQGYSSIGRALFLNEVEGLIDGISN